ncbi:MAG: glycosyltransferase [Nanoarchaeota archaeon]|nr:glycosyltransferase [Nanoarchaeota archaeon]
MVKVSLYITCYNYEKYVKKAIESALNQNFDDYEVLIFDDGSSDNSRDIINEYKDNPKVRIFFQENQGLIKTSNKALKEAKGKYVMRLDADDFLDENALLVMVTILERENNTYLVYPDYYEVDEEDNITGFVRRKKINREVKFLDLPAHGACTLIDKEVLLKLGGYDESVKRQDGYNLWIKFIQKFNPRNVNVPLFYYRKHIESSTANSKKILEARRKIKENHVMENNVNLHDETLVIVPFRGKNVIENMYHQDIKGSILLDFIERNLESVRSDLVITSEDDLILDFFAKKGFNIVKRPEELARQNVSIDKTLKYVLSKLDKTYKNIGIYYPTSPLVSSKHINEAIDTLGIFDADAVVSVKEVSKVFFIHGMNGLMPLFNKHKDLKIERENIYEETGSIIVYKIEFLLEDKVPLKVGHIVLDDIEGMDIDDEFSFWLIKQVLSNGDELDNLKNRKITRGY